MTILSVNKSRQLKEERWTERTLQDHQQQVHRRQARRAFAGARRPQPGASGASLAALPSHSVRSWPPGLGCPPAPDAHRGDPRYCAPSRPVALPPHPPHAPCVPAASGRLPEPARRHPSRGARPRGFPPERRRARGRPGARGPGRGGRQARAAVLGQTAGHAVRTGRGRALTGEVMRRTAPRSSLDCLSASEPSPSLRTATAAQPPPQIASRFPCLLRRRCPLSSARARRRGGPWDRWSGPRPPFRSRSRTALPGPVRRSSALTSPCTWC